MGWNGNNQGMERGRWKPNLADGKRRRPLGKRGNNL
jgi:hypothetical protein